MLAAKYSCRIPKIFCIAILFYMFYLFIAPGISANISLPDIISDNMVLQQGVSPQIWGNADPGEKIRIAFDKQSTDIVADNQGKWSIKLNPVKAGGPYKLDITGNNIIKIDNIAVGEVWVCSGQSNMQWNVGGSINPQKEIAELEYPMIRMFTAQRTVADRPMANAKGSWAVCKPDTVGSFSAVGYFFGRSLHKKLGVPIGLINTSWGGTPAESWTDTATLESDPDFKPILDRWKKAMDEYPQALEKYKEQLSQWEKDTQKAKDEGKPEPKKPNPPLSPDNPWRPAGLYNAMIAPLIPYAIKGAIWYQGESNADRAYQYRKLFPAMISNWRRSWDQGDFPFLFVQLANFMDTKPEPGESAWAELREAQSMALTLPSTGMAVIIDIGEAKDIHPKNKQDVGYRLSLWAMANVYGYDVACSGPIYESMLVEGSKIRLKFKYVDGGLKVDGEALNGFAIAGEDNKFLWAQAEIDGDSVLVWNSAVAKPVSVRYAWADNPICNLYNKESLPASPFRTDSLPGVTESKK